MNKPCEYCFDQQHTQIVKSLKCDNFSALKSTLTKIMRKRQKNFPNILKMRIFLSKLANYSLYVNCQKIPYHP